MTKHRLVLGPRTIRVRFIQGAARTIQGAACPQSASFR